MFLRIQLDLKKWRVKMQEVFEKIIEKLKKESFLTTNDDGETDELSIKVVDFQDAVNVIRQAAEEYNNGWISVEDTMPTEHDSMFAKLKDKWRSSMFEKTSDMVQVTVSDNDGNSITTTAHTLDGKWSCDILRINSSYRITHWKPLSEPYQPKGDKE